MDVCVIILNPLSRLALRLCGGTEGILSISTAIVVNAQLNPFECIHLPNPDISGSSMYAMNFSCASYSSGFVLTVSFRRQYSMALLGITSFVGSSILFLHLRAAIRAVVPMCRAVIQHGSAALRTNQKYRRAIRPFPPVFVRVVSLPLSCLPLWLCGW